MSCRACFSVRAIGIIFREFDDFLASSSLGGEFHSGLDESMNGLSDETLIRVIDFNFFSVSPFFGESIFEVKDGHGSVEIFTH